MSEEESTVEDLYNLHKSGENDSNIKKMRLKDIKPNPNNPRVLRDDKFQKLKQSITEFPKMLSLRPMVIDENNVVLGGNMRLRALQELGFTDVEEAWVKRSSDLTEDEKKRFIIADNVAFGEWDWDTLANDWEVVDLEDWGLDVPQFNIENEDIYEEVEESIEDLDTSIEIYFKSEDYNQAFSLIKYWKDNKAYVGGMILEYLNNEKNKIVNEN